MLISGDCVFGRALGWNGAPASAPETPPPSCLHAEAAQQSRRATSVRFTALSRLHHNGAARYGNVVPPVFAAGALMPSLTPLTEPTATAL